MCLSFPLSAMSLSVSVSTASPLSFLPPPNGVMDCFMPFDSPIRSPYPPSIYPPPELQQPRTSSWWICVVCLVFLSCQAARVIVPAIQVCVLCSPRLLACAMSPSPWYTNVPARMLAEYTASRLATVVNKDYCACHVAGNTVASGHGINEVSSTLHWGTSPGDNHYGQTTAAK